jgi:hypothetical protein
MTDEWCPSSGEHSMLTKDVTSNADAAHSADADLALGVSEADIRLVDAFYHEVALEASNDRAPATHEEQAANAALAESFARLNAMTPDELRAERARRREERRLRGGR